MTRNEVRKLWKMTDTPDVVAEAERLAEDAHEHGYELDLSEVLLLAFWAGLKAKETSP